MPHSKIQALFERYETEAARTAAGAGIDEVHDYRVTIRRLGQALEVLEEWLPRRRAAAIRWKAGKRLKLAGKVRDRDIALDLVEKLSLVVPEKTRQQLATSRAALAAKLEKKAAKPLKRLQPRAAPPLRQLAATLLPELSREFLQTGAQLASNPGSRKRLHRFRISAKRFRYTMELFSESVPGVEDAIGRVRAIQTALGDLQDCVATRALLDGAGGEAIKQEEQRRLHAFQEAWKTNFGSPTVASAFAFSLQ